MNDTSSMNKIYKSKKFELEDYVSKFQAQENDIGVIYAIGDKIEGIDIFTVHICLNNISLKLSKVVY